MKRYVEDIFSLFIPDLCPVCGEVMPEGAHALCTRCRWEAPLTGYWREVDNPVARKFWGMIPFVNASSFLFFVHGSPFRDLIHGFKYRGRWKQALQMGEWFGGELFRSGLYSDVDVIIPVPLHLRKRINRGYNQSEYIARGLARELGVPVKSGNLVRIKHNPSQTRKRHSERWDNVSGIFSVRRADSLRGLHILLVDDVLTTGATITACAEALLEYVPDCRISLVTLAVSRGEIETV